MKAHSLRLLAATAAIAVATLAAAQTPPVQPKTPDVVVPAAVRLPGPPQGDPNVSGRPLTAAEAVAIALRRQPNVNIARSNVEAAKGRVQQAQSDLLPGVTASASYSDSKQFTGPAGNGTTGKQISSGVTLDQLIFDFNRTRDQVNQQRALERASEHTLTQTESDTALDVKQAFYTYSQNVAFETISDANIANRQSQLELAQARLNSGLGAPIEVVQAKTSLAQAVISLTSARSAVASSRIALAQTLGIDPRTPINPAAGEETDFPNPDLTALVNEALLQRADILAGQESVAAAKYGVSSASKGNLPKLAFSASTSGRGDNRAFDTTSGGYSLTLSWPLFDSGFTAGSTREARASQVSAEERLRQLGQQVVADVSQGYIDLLTARQQVDLAGVEVANAQEQLRISEGRYRGGIGLFTDVTSAQSALYGAQRDQIQAQNDLQRARASLARAVGNRA